MDLETRGKETAGYHYPQGYAEGERQFWPSNPIVYLKMEFAKRRLPAFSIPSQVTLPADYVY